MDNLGTDVELSVACGLLVALWEIHFSWLELH